MVDVVVPGFVTVDCVTVVRIVLGVVDVVGDGFGGIILQSFE